MPNWTESMQQTFEYYVVDPGTWQDKTQLTYVKSCSITWDSESSTIGSATIDADESIGEAYVRIYLITIQNGIREKHALGTFLVQTPSTSFDGKVTSYSMDAYSSLLELDEKYPNYGFFAEKSSADGKTILQKAYSILTTGHLLRAPVIKQNFENTDILHDNFVADPKDTYLKFITDLIGNVNYIFNIDELGRVSFIKKHNLDELNPVWTFDDGNSSILLPKITMDRDLYGVPNVVEVVCSNSSGTIRKIVKNEDPDSPTSIKNRGREIWYRVTDPDMLGDATEERVADYANSLLKELSSIEYTISYEHGYCPVKIGDCVRLNYEKAGLVNVKAKVISQDIKCETGCTVTEKAVFVNKLWR